VIFTHKVLAQQKCD